MKSCISIIMMSLFFVFVIYLEIDLDMASLLNQRVKNALNRATHDASLCLDKEKASYGKTVFDQNTAISTFKASLSYNLGLNEKDLSPLPETAFVSKPTVEMIDFIDDDDNVIYPFLYENKSYGISKLLKGPAVISVIKMEKPIFCSLSPKLDYRKWAVYEYPYPK